MNVFDDFLEKLHLRAKEKEKETIPKGYVKCVRCRNVVKEDRASIVLPDEHWVCDKCFFGDAI